DEGGREDAHEAREQYQVGRAFLDRRRERRIEGLARGEGLVVDHLGRQALLARPLEALRIGPVGDHRLHFEAGAGLDDRAHVAAPSGDEDDRGSQVTTVCGPPARSPMAPISNACTPLAASVAIVACDSAAGTISTMPMPQLNVRCISDASMFPFFISQRKTGG